MSIIRVGLESRSYNIEIESGLLARAGDVMLPVLAQRRVFVVTDENVAALHLPRLEASLAASGIAYVVKTLPPGEHTKDFTHLEDLLDAMQEARCERTTAVVALGGGVIGDLAGFAAAVLLRGVPFIQIPTTLLAQVDSSVGGKTAIDTRWGKNMVGAFHQPRLVIADIAVLNTLPEREVKTGYAEIVKYGLIDNADFFQWLEHNAQSLIAGDENARRHAVEMSCLAKAAIVSADEHEHNRRALLNLGHTFAHALEAETGYGDLLRHGEAVSIGLVMAFQLSVDLGLCPQTDLDRLRRHLASLGMPLAPPPLTSGAWDARRLLDHMQSDKKVKDGRITFILAGGIGGAFVSHDVNPVAALAAMERVLAAHPMEQVR
jgi:3-dehydroquinate synthase